MSQQNLINKVEELRKFVTDTLALDIQQMAQSEYLLNYVRDNLRKTNKLIFVTSISGEILAQLNGAQQQLTNFNSNKNPGHFQNYLNSLANVIKIMPAPLRQGRDKQKDTLSSVASHAQTLVDRLDGKSSELEEKISELNSRVTQLKDSASSTVEESNRKIETYAETFEANSNQELSDFLLFKKKRLQPLLPRMIKILLN